MRLIIDDVDESIYGDLIISPRELSALKFGEMICAQCVHDGKRYYFGVRLQGLWDDEQDWYEEDYC